MSSTHSSQHDLCKKKYKWNGRHNILLKPRRTRYYSINTRLLAQMFRPLFRSSSGIHDTRVVHFLVCQRINVHPYFTLTGFIILQPLFCPIYIFLE
jgi:hypothetical protein